MGILTSWWGWVFSISRQCCWWGCQCWRHCDLITTLWCWQDSVECRSVECRHYHTWGLTDWLTDCRCPHQSPSVPAFSSPGGQGRPSPTCPGGAGVSCYRCRPGHHLRLLLTHTPGGVIVIVINKNNVRTLADSGGHHIWPELTPGINLASHTHTTQHHNTTTLAFSSYDIFISDQHYCGLS